MPRRDSGREGAIVDEETFTFITELETRKANRLHYVVSVLAILPDAEGDGEIRNPRSLAEELAGVVSLLIRGTDLIRLPAPSPTLHVLLVDARLEHLHVVIRRITEEVSQRLFETNGEDKAVRLSVGGACFPTTAGTSQDLLNQADTLAREARRDQVGRLRYKLPGSTR
ncbi:MAG: hypothetical protein ACE5JI_04630 [Acidobacteriota bacterium]